MCLVIFPGGNFSLFDNVSRWIKFIAWLTMWSVQLEGEDPRQLSIKLKALPLWSHIFLNSGEQRYFLCIAVDNWKDHFCQLEQILKFDIACSSYFFMNKLHHKMLILYIFASPSSSVLIVASDNCEWSKSNKVIDCNNRNPLPSEEIVEKWKDHKTLVLQWETEYSQMRIFGCKN